jgi:hypothetical protein
VTGADSERETVAVNIRRYHDAAQAGLGRENVDFEVWFDNSIKECCELKRGKELSKSNADFGRWLDQRGLGNDFLAANNRAAMIAIATCSVELVRDVVKNTTSRNWHNIWRNLVQPKLKRLCNPTKTSRSPNNGGSTEGPAPEDIPPGDIVAWFEWLLHGITELSRDCEKEFHLLPRSKEDAREFARNIKRALLNLVFLAYSHNDDDWGLVLEEVQLVDKVRRQTAP